MLVHSVLEADIRERLAIGVADPRCQMRLGWQRDCQSEAEPQDDSRMAQSDRSRRSCSRGEPYFGASAAVSPGGKMRNVKIETFSPGLNGPATSFLTAGMLRRKATIAATSSFTMYDNA